ncbi:MAG: ABC transporter permease subunit, partial [Nitrospinaceae bacterium]
GVTGPMKANEELKIKLLKFRTDKRAYYSMLALAIAFLITLPAELICNVRPLLLVVEGKPYFPILFAYSEKDFGGTLPSEPDYKSGDFLKLLNGGTVPGESRSQKDRTANDEEVEENILHLEMSDFEEEDVEEAEFSIGLEDFEEEESLSPTKQVQIPPPPGAGSQAASEPKEYWMIWPPVRYDYQYIPTESKTGRVVLAAPYETPSADRTRTIPSSWQDGHYLGTDDRGRDVLARLIYGFRVSMIFGLSLAITGTLLGCLLGGIQGFFGGWVDLIGQRLTEIWGSIPRLYILIILSAFLVPSPILLFAILNLTAWMGIAAYIRAEFLKTRNLEYVKAARALGVSDFKIMRKHILPNSLTPVITFFPFEVTAGILALVSLDYLNLGIPSPAPSIGELLAQGKNNLQARWILLPTFVMLTTSLTLLTFIGDGIRNAFDPRKSV